MTDVTSLRGEGTTSPPPGRRRARATMRDVAALAGVGVKTVSRVINGEPDVSDAMIERVNEAARKLNFQRDLIASNLRRSGRRSLSIGLLLASVDNPFAASIHRAVEDVAEAEGVAVFTASTDERPEREERLVAAFVARRVDGLIVTATGADQRYLLPEMEAGTPVVTVDRPPVGIDADCVMVNNTEAARQATEHLIAQGHRRIAFLGDRTRIATANLRLAGYRAAMMDAGLAIDPTLVVEDQRGEAVAQQSVERLLTMPDAPTALFTAQNLITIGAIRALRHLGLHHQVALVGFDDISLSDLLEPALTVVAQDPPAIGRAAAQRMFARMQNPTLPAELITVPATLIVRGSGEIPGPGGA